MPAENPQEGTEHNSPPVVYSNWHLDVNIRPWFSIIGMSLSEPQRDQKLSLSFLTNCSSSFCPNVRSVLVLTGTQGHLKMLSYFLSQLRLTTVCLSVTSDCG